MARTLDIKELQIIREFPDDEDGYYWHHRVCLHRVRPGVWVTLTPDLDFELVDLNLVRHKLVPRAGAFPQPEQPFLYAFDPTPQREIDRQRSLAREWVTLFGEGGGDVDSSVWVVSDPRDSLFGETVPSDTVEAGGEDFVEMDGRGLARIQDEVHFCEMVRASELEAMLARWRQADGDCRILKVRRGPGGARSMTLDAANQNYTEDKLEDWPHAGEKAYRELSLSVREADENWVAYHNSWERDSGVAAGSATCHEHRTICEVFRLGHTVDQLNAPNLASFEMLARRLVQIELATERNPRAPDYTGLSVVFSGPRQEGGGARVTRFSEWVAGRQRDRAQLMKQSRLFREERDHEKKLQGVRAGGGGGKGKGRGQGRGRGGDPDGAAGSAGAQ